MLLLYLNQQLNPSNEHVRVNDDHVLDVLEVRDHIDDHDRVHDYEAQVHIDDHIDDHDHIDFHDYVRFSQLLIEFAFQGYFL